jgi:hypothetical protein
MQARVWGIDTPYIPHLFSHPNPEQSRTNTTILALDLGKYKCVACATPQTLTPRRDAQEVSPPDFRNPNHPGETEAN